MKLSNLFKIKLNKENTASYFQGLGTTIMTIGLYIGNIGMLSVVPLFVIDLLIQLIEYGEFHLFEYGTGVYTISILLIGFLGLLFRTIVVHVGMCTYYNGVKLECLINIENNTSK